MQRPAALLALALAVLPAVTSASCRQALALGLDVSGSVDSREYRLQLDGLARALESPRVADRLLEMPDAPVALAVYEWSGPDFQSVILPWTEITDAGTLAGVATLLRNHPRAVAPPTTALGTAILTGYRLLEQRRDCWIRTLDISGDGKANTGPRPQTLPDPPAGVTVNALVIGVYGAEIGDLRQAEIKELRSYFEANVIRGDGAFTESALGFDAYAAAMERKLLRELKPMLLGQLTPRP
jgi:hypothetical protein